MESIDKDTIVDEIERKLWNSMHKHVGRSEVQAWTHSLLQMYKVLNSNEIPDDAGVAIEYNIPQTSKRVDFLISGHDDKNDDHVIIVELKQWESLQKIEGRDALVETFIGGGVRPVVHPSYQAWSYAQLIKDYNSIVQDENISLHPCAFLHNYNRGTNDDLDNEIYKDYLDEAPAFTKGQALDLREYIKKVIKKGDRKDILYRIENGRIKPSKSLQKEIKKMIDGNPSFTMIDDQKVAFEEIMFLAKQAKEENEKHVIIVEGGPGTGKSVIAVNLLANLTLENQFCQYVSKNAAPRQVYKEELKAGKVKTSVIDLMFKGSGSYTETPESLVDTLIVDEAHRLNEKSGMFKNLGENQIKEIILSAKCSVFFIDEHQRVTISDIGSINEIEEWADYYGANISKLKLESQFRCNGSDGYLAWVDDVLQIRTTANYSLDDLDYDLRICDTPNEMRDLVVEKNSLNNNSRILAGYCWDWIKEGKRNTQVHDIKIGDFEISWNLDGDIYALESTSINEAGCIHTTQGLEFDYVGLIIGDDLRYENGRIVTDFTKRASTDQSLKGIKSLVKKDPEEANRIADEIIKNTYRTLMTRGMKGCYIYCTDEGLRKYLKSRLN